MVRLGSERGAWLGVALADLDAAQAASLKLPAAQGVRVERVEPGSPAEKAGVQPTLANWIAQTRPKS